MQCPSCGQPTDRASRFCPQCGTPLPSSFTGGNTDARYTAGPDTASPPYAAIPTVRPELSRPRAGRIIAGVCAAFARTYGWNVTLIRILLVVLTPFHLGLGFLAYLIAWIVIPEDPLLLPPGDRVQL